MRERELGHSNASRRPCAAIAAVQVRRAGHNSRRNGRIDSWEDRKRASCARLRRGAPPVSAAADTAQFHTEKLDFRVRTAERPGENLLGCIRRIILQLRAT